MKRRRPQGPSVCTLVTVLITGAAMLINPCASQEINPFAEKRIQEYDERKEAKEEAIVLPCFPPDEENVTSAPMRPPQPPPTLNPSMWPTVAATPSPSMWPTVAATRSPTLSPTVAATPSPTLLPTVEATPSPTLLPTVGATPSPTMLPTRAPVPQTLAPVTPEPSTASTAAPRPPPTTSPTVSSTTLPTTSPIESMPVPTLSPVANQPMLSSFPDITGPPASSFVETSLQPFAFTLAIAEAQAASGSDDDPDVVTAEVQRILTEFLFENLSEGDYGDGVSLTSVALNVTPQSRRALRDNTFEPRLRSLQTETLSFGVTGMAIFQVAQGSSATQQGLTNEVNVAAKEIMDDPDKQDELEQEFQASDSEVLSQTVSVSAQLQEPTDDGIGKPSPVSLFFGFLIAGLGAVGVGIYLYAFIKKKRKRARKRKQERQGQYEGYGAAVNTTQSTMSANASIPSPEPKVMARSPPQNKGESLASSSASSSASYEGATSEESSGTVSDFARELELAASLDKRTWTTTQEQREAWERNNSEFGKSTQYPSQYAWTSSNGKGVGVRNVSGGGKQAPNISSFPYGDEPDNVDSDSVDLNVVKGSKGEDLFSEDDEGVEWTESGVWNPYDGYGKQKDRSAVENTTDTAPESRDRKQRDSNAYMKSYSSIDTAPENRQRQKRDSNAHMKSWSSIDTARRDSSHPFGEDEESDQARETLLGVSAEGAHTRSTSETPPASPTASSAGTSNAVRMSSIATATTDVAIEQTNEPTQVKAELVSKEADDSLLTVDIVKEVHRLARFVKRYERKSHKKEQKELERISQVASANEVRSVPSEGYDALSDSISALRKGPPEASPRGQRIAISNAVEESDETDRSWSTESRANSDFEDDDEEFSTPIDESEVDVSDSSVDEDVSDAASDESRLGITPFSMQKVVVPPKSSPPETSRPPVTGQKGKGTGLSPVPGTPASPEEVSPEKTYTPIQNVKRIMRRVNSARQRKSAEKSTHAQTPAKRPRESELTEGALRDMSVEGSPLDVPSLYQQKGDLQSLRKNDAILDTASSIVTDGVTPSQHDRAFQVNEVVPQGRFQTSQRFQAKAYGKMQERVPRDPTPTKPIDGRNLTRQQTPPQQRAVELRSPSLQPALPLYGRDSAEPIAPRVASVMRNQTVQRISPSKSPGNSRPTTPTGSRSPFISSFAKPPESAEATTPKSDTGRRSAYTSPFGKPLESTYQPESRPSGEGPRETRDPPAAPLEDAATGASPTVRNSPANRMDQDASPMKTQEMAPAFPSSGMSSPPRRKAKTSAAFSSIVNMFESKPKEAIFPPNESWQYNC